jgi:hypothetical protein
MTPIDLSQIPLADNHCHGFYLTQEPVDVFSWRKLFTESSDPGMQSKHGATVDRLRGLSLYFKYFKRPKLTHIILYATVLQVAALNV